MDKQTFEDIIDETGTIFRDIDVFGPNYLPEIYKYRDKQLYEMVSFCRGLKNGHPPQNMMLVGKYATGKTSTILKYFNLIEERFNNVLCVHINCQVNKTEYKVFTQIYKRLFGENVNVNGLSTFNIFEKLMKEIRKDNKILIVALDDFDFIKNDKELNKTLYNLLRAHETYNNAKISVITITSQRKSIILNDSVISSFHPVEINFPRYTHSQIFDILKHRCIAGFYPGVISEKLINLASDYTFEREDLRYGIKLLSKAGERAETYGSSKITEDYIY
ncbi:Cdc6-like protein [Methanobrevibacter arboriphilus JCM 13429 = DSM 1125]|uniref:Cdc6-like protein n=1 Tax=Methanobrevibacter arboriphilus JCM 13429 = DSM 1125 TaxID=1300164 RepID=A0A1V6N2X9_METAZ|nr:AAA family ATPase [Methanobrevibacter arboriphilus]OQD59025.1 Cdc6-like protein [Methanobrevibacter arboriphilus JCM 13429 = DSM 1125]